MSNYKFSDAERYAVFETHGARCYICREPVNYASFQVDHVIPESLDGKPKELKQCLKDLGRPEDFQINSFENWLPSCAPCNNRKRNTVWESSRLIQVDLQYAATKADAARAAATEVVSDLKLTRSLNTLGRALEAGGLTPALSLELDAFVERYSHHRAPNAEPDVVRITETQALPLYEVITIDDGCLEIARGPYGIGGGPVNESSAMRCTCGSPWFNGTRCILCGQQLDD